MQKPHAAAPVYALTARWLSLIEREFIQISQPYHDARVTRLVDTLRFWIGARLFATLEARPQGLLFSDCTKDPLECVALNFVQAREVVGLALEKTAEEAASSPPTSHRPASPDRYGRVTPLHPDASAR